MQSLYNGAFVAKNNSAKAMCVALLGIIIQTCQHIVKKSNSL